MTGWGEQPRQAGVRGVYFVQHLVTSELDPGEHVTNGRIRNHVIRNDISGKRRLTCSTGDWIFQAFQVDLECEGLSSFRGLLYAKTHQIKNKPFSSQGHVFLSPCEFLVRVGAAGRAFILSRSQPAAGLSLGRQHRRRLRPHKLPSPPPRFWQIA